MKKRLLVYPLAHVLLFLPWLSGAVNWQLKTEVTPLSINATGQISIGENLDSLSINEDGKLVSGSENELYVLSKNLDVIMKIPSDLATTNVQLVLKKPASLASGDITGEWIFQELKVDNSLAAQGGSPGVSGTIGTLDFKTNGDLFFEGELGGTYSVDEAKHVVVDTGDPEDTVFGINESKDIMVGLSTNGDEYVLRILTRLNADATDANMADPWTWFMFDIDDVNTDFPNVRFDSGPVVFDANGTYLITSPEGEVNQGTHSVSTDGVLTFFANQLGEVDDEYYISQSRAFMSSLQSDETITQMAMFQRDAVNYTLADLEGDWESNSFYLRVNPIVNGDGVAYSFSRGNVVFSFPTQIDVVYEVQSSINLEDWSEVSTIFGDGNEKEVVIPWEDDFPGEDKVFFKIVISTGD